MCAKKQTNYVNVPNPRRMVVLDFANLKVLHERIHELLDGASNVPESMQNFHIGETDNELICVGWGLWK